MKTEDEIRKKFEVLNGKLKIAEEMHTDWLPVIRALVYHYEWILGAGGRLYGIKELDTDGTIIH